MENFKKKSFTVLKYIAFGVVIGVLVGAIDTLFGRVLIAITDFRTDYYLFLLPFLPLAGLLITWMYNKFSAVSLKGMSLVFETGQSKRNSIPLPLVPLVMIGTWITHLFGGSAGREGVAVQIGATLSHRIGRKFHFSNNERVLLITGMSAGFGGLFQTPLGAVFFALEVIVAGYLEYEALLPAFIASIVACITSHTLGLEKFSVNVTDTLDFTDYKVIIFLVIMGIAFGLVGRLFSYLLQKSKDFMKNKIKNLIIIFLLGFSIVFNGYLFIENKNKATTIVQLNKKTKELEKYSELLETGTATEYMDIKESDGLISMAYLYQDKELIEWHGIGVIIGKQYYRIGIAPEIGTTLNKNSKIIKITENEIEFTFNLNNDTEKKRLIVQTENNDIHFKLEDVS